MRISVVVCTHTEDRLPALRDAIESVLDQTYSDRELIVVSDGNPTVAQQVQAEFGEHPDVRVRLQATNRGLLATRNTGASLAQGDVVAFLDDDAVADPKWLAELARTYQEQDIDSDLDHDYPLAVGGKMTPEWIADEPTFLPAEFYWLIGVTHRGFADGPGEVRNTPGSNFSMRRAVFEELDGFDTEIGGRQGNKQLQGGETELCARLRNRYGVGVFYTPDARVAHKVFEYRTDIRWLVTRAFWQGYSKRGMKVLLSEETTEQSEAPQAVGRSPVIAEESAFLGQLVREFIPQRLFDGVRQPSFAAFSQLFMVVVFTTVVGIGYGYGVLAWFSSTSSLS
ncbi:glycosyltransferase family 2 protein [Halocatena pleomorpha]|uniref:Glycosyltransferase family 2 protein n=1 Tax=Halocatena pleomorpha TaxID=1785090 RepID=A0A3P3RBM3_9EURY|nr:glycosyltransferase family 2 protein [Halocatena pleomorpha]RRJ29863.1 glycosyltransferase family 2 protein [Halocatena pleomorpha]